MEEFKDMLGPVLKARGVRAFSTTAAFNQTYKAQCDFSWSRCRQNDYMTTFFPSNPLNRSGVTYTGPEPRIRLDQQPFLVAGDTYLYRKENENNIIVARLTTGGSSQYLVSRDRLRIDNNVVTQDIVVCETRNDDACYNDAARRNKVVLPQAYRFWTSNYSTVAASEWGVHWADVSELSTLSGVWEQCADTGRMAIQVTSSYGTSAAQGVRVAGRNA